jgi:RNA recognition motif-containing protein
MTSIFVAKLDFNTTEEQLKSLFEEHGKVNRVTIAKDRETGKPRGFAFVEMADESEADKAIEALDDSSVNGRNIAVKKADDRASGGKPSGDRPAFRSDRPREDRGPGSDVKSDFKKSDDSRPPSKPAFNPDEVNPMKVERKKEIKPAGSSSASKEAPKKPKMEAYKKSGKNNKFFDDDDADELEWELENRRNMGWEDDEDDEDEDDL